jgi:hypothetical protein
MSESRPVVPNRSVPMSSPPAPADAERQAGAPARGGARPGRRVDCSEAPPADAAAARERSASGGAARRSSHPPRR